MLSDPAAVQVGLDAQAAYGFHSLRERKPYLTSTRMMNQAWYSIFSCCTGWFCCTKPLSSRARLLVQHPGSEAWEEVRFGSQVKALVVLNLQSYAGGRNLWGTEDSHKCKHGDPEMRSPRYNDGLLEVVGLINGYHTGLVMASKGDLVHALRICQVSLFLVELRRLRVS